MLVWRPACDSPEIYLHPTIISGAPSRCRRSEAGITVPPLGREPALHCAIRSLITGPQLNPEVGFTAGVGSWELVEGGGGGVETNAKKENTN